MPTRQEGRRKPAAATVEPWQASGQAEEVDDVRSFEEWALAGYFPEMTPSRQQRSLRSALAMLDAGRMLLRERALDELSIEAICSQAGTAVGGFYGRFESKHAFFVTMQRLQILRSEGVRAAFIERIASADMPLDQVCRFMVDLSVSNFRNNLGVLRASLKYSDNDNWALYKRTGDHFRAELARHIAPRLDWLPPAQRQLRVMAAYQVLVGTLVHAVLTDPGPLRLDAQAMGDELTRMILAYLGSPVR